VEEAVVVAPAAGAVPPELEPADEDAFTEAILRLYNKILISDVSSL